LGLVPQDVLYLWLSTALPVVQQGSQESFNSDDRETSKEQFVTQAGVRIWVSSWIICYFFC